MFTINHRHHHDHHVHGEPQVEARLRALETKLDLIIANQEKIMDDLNKLLDQAEANAKRETDAEAAVEALLTTLSQQIADLKNSAPSIPAETLARITALSDGIGSRADKMAAAVVAGTPAAPAG